MIELLIQSTLPQSFAIDLEGAVFVTWHGLGQVTQNTTELRNKQQWKLE